MSDWVTIGISILALLTSGVTAWATLFRKGQLKMTRPTVVFFGPDGGAEGKGHSKVFLRTLLYSTSKRGQVVESMHIRLERGETKQNFSIWVYGEDRLVRGSGLSVGPEGIAANHHFLLPPDGADFHFLAGDYALTVFARLVGKADAIELARVELAIKPEDGKKLEDPDAGIYFDWGADQQRYNAHVELRRACEIPPWLMEMANKAPAADAASPGAPSSPPSTQRS
ncbi:MAG: hypothetical protein JXM70_13705 [Pirellulales bacterium]|nr:hypothetical protein [Pirellulales bacterium]